MTDISLDGKPVSTVGLKSDVYWSVLALMLEVELKAVDRTLHDYRIVGFTIHEHGLRLHWGERK